MGRRREDYHCNQCGRRLPNGKYTLCDECHTQFIKNNLLKKEEKKIEVAENKTTKKRNTTVDKKNKNKVKVEFIGESHTGVVGSSVAISYPTINGEYETILIENGMVQKNGRLQEEYAVNKEVMNRARSYEDFKAIFVSHAHL